MHDPIPEEALQAAAEVLYRSYDSEYGADHLSWRDFTEPARAVLEAAAPILAAQVRRQVAEEIAALADVKHPGYTPAKFDAFLRQYGLTYPHLRPALKAVAAYIGRGDHDLR